MEYANDDKLEWIVVFIYEFGKKFGLSMKQAFSYLSRYKGIEFVDKHYGYAHTQSFESMVDDVSALCRRMGGQLR